MTSLWRLVLRLVIGPAAVASFAAVELRRDGHLAQAAGAYLAFTASIFLISAWGRWQLRLIKRRLDRTRGRLRRRRIP